MSNEDITNETTKETPEKCIAGVVAEAPELTPEEIKAYSSIPSELMATVVSTARAGVGLLNDPQRAAYEKAWKINEEVRRKISECVPVKEDNGPLVPSSLRSGVPVTSNDKTPSM